MNLAEYSEARAAAATALEELIAEHSHVLGPVDCPMHDDTADCGDDCTITPIGDVFTRTPHGWLLTIGYVTDETDGSSQSTYLKPPRQSTFLSIGLARAASRDHG